MESAVYSTLLIADAVFGVYLLVSIDLLTTARRIPLPDGRFTRLGDGEKGLIASRRPQTAPLTLAGRPGSSTEPGAAGRPALEGR